MHKVTCMSAIVRTGNKRVPSPMDMELKVFVSSGKQNRILCKSDMYSSLVSYPSCLIKCLELIMSPSIKSAFVQILPYYLIYFLVAYVFYWSFQWELFKVHSPMFKYNFKTIHLHSFFFVCAYRNFPMSDKYKFESSFWL